jgi:hypothetical protein
MNRVFDRYEPDEWTTTGETILSAENRVKLEQEFKRGPVVIQHWLYRGMSGPRLTTAEDMDEFEAYLTAHAVPGDAFDIWSFAECCGQDKQLAGGKLPDIDGCTPKRGAY